MKILNIEINDFNSLKTSILSKATALKFDHKMLLAGFVILGLLAFINRSEDPVETIAVEPKPQSVDTFIPRGHVLIPLELANAEALGSIIGDMGGVVDLYLGSEDRKSSGQLVASRVKLVRAPLNPDQFAVLVKESEGGKILQRTGPFIAVIQNPEARGANLAKETKNTVRIEYSN